MNFPHVERLLFEPLLSVWDENTKDSTVTQFLTPRTHPATEDKFNALTTLLKVLLATSCFHFYFWKTCSEVHPRVHFPQSTAWIH